MKSALILLALVYSVHTLLLTPSMKFKTDDGLQSEDDVLLCFQTTDLISQYAQELLEQIKAKEAKGETN